MARKNTKLRLVGALKVRRAAALLVAVLFGASGFVAVNLANAATFVSSAEAEQGNVVGNASLAADQAASGGQAVQFGNAIAGQYRVQGNKIYAPSGSQFFTHGVARPSLEWGCTGQGVAGGDGIPASDFLTMRNSWSANTVRIAVNQDFWLSGAARHCPDYKATVAAVIQSARTAGLVVIIDLHWSDMGNLSNQNPGQQCMADANSITFWQQFATIYKQDTGVWFEMYNEPHDIEWDVWKNGGSACGFGAVGMQSLYSAIRGTGATNIVVATGKEWGSRLDGVPLLEGLNIIYAIHPYAKDIVPGGNPDDWSHADWDSRFGYLTTSVPVIATEFGRTACSRTTTYDQAILEYFRTHGMGYTAWAWYVGGCGFPSLISNAEGQCVEYGCAVQNNLKSFENGSITMVTPTGAGQ